MGGHRRNRREGCRGAGDVELLGLGKNGNPSRVLLDQVNLEPFTGGPPACRTVHSGRATGGGDFLLQSDIDVGKNCLQEQDNGARTVSEHLTRSDRNATQTDHVVQDDCEVSGVSGNGSPLDGLRPLAGIPGGTLSRGGDGESQGGDSEEQGRGEDGEGTHY